MAKTEGGAAGGTGTGGGAGGGIGTEGGAGAGSEAWAGGGAEIGPKCSYFVSLKLLGDLAFSLIRILFKESFPIAISLMEVKIIQFCEKLSKEDNVIDTNFDHNFGPF